MFLHFDKTQVYILAAHAFLQLRPTANERVSVRDAEVFLARTNIFTIFDLFSLFLRTNYIKTFEK